MSAICVRAGLGTQIFQFLIGLAYYKKTLKDIHWWYPYKNTDNKKIRPDSGKEFYIEKLYNLNDFFIHKNSNRTDLVPTIDHKNIECVIKNIDFIRNCLKENFEIKPNNLSVLHKRGWDTPFLDENFYKDFESKIKLTVISDSSKNDYKKLTDACDDFVKIYNSNECIGAWSMFTISAAVLNPKMNLHIIKHKYWSTDVYGGINRKNMCINLSNIFVKNFSNINWYEE